MVDWDKIEIKPDKEVKVLGTYLLDIKKKMDGIQEYGRLIQKVFGVNLEAGIAVYKFYNDKMKSLYFGDE